MPIADTIVFKPKFIERYSKLTDWDEFKKYCLAFLPRSIRVNTLKANVADVKKSIEAKGWILEAIPWCDTGFWIHHPDRRDTGNLLEHKLGYIYIQESVSMLPPLFLDPKPGEMVLDMCAAPGSKTSQIATMMKNEGLLLANDYRGQRIQSLGINLQRMGVTNCVVTLMNGEKFSGLTCDKILVDAPCSGTGTIRKSLKTIRIWNPKMLRKISNQQKKLLMTAWKNVVPGGVVVYSTCSLEPEENEAVVTWLLENVDDAELEEVKLPGLKVGKAVKEFEGAVYHKDIDKVCRVWPQDNNTEGFFVAKFRKKDND
ncbi:RsmB/NOP family class I SAM-dependent RNA methyltransferase [archaeon]|nr:RsmB/NOP family class I SAM-dependent RNA methyltransferase [archaeon]MBT6761784.1 RsmB/NOP family class I SAM-dependent RNA methyltransferase [archaeon]